MRSAIAAAYRDLKDTKAARTSFHMPGLQGRRENKSQQLQYRQEKLTLPEKKKKTSPENQLHGSAKSADKTAQSYLSVEISTIRAFDNCV